MLLIYDQTAMQCKYSWFRLHAHALATLESKLNIKRPNHNTCYFIDIVSFSMRITVALFRLTMKSQTTKLYLNQLYKVMPRNKLFFVDPVVTKQNDKWRHQISQSYKWTVFQLNMKYSLSYKCKTKRMICLLFDCHASNSNLWRKLRLKSGNFPFLNRTPYEFWIVEENSIRVLSL